MHVFHKILLQKLNFPRLIIINTNNFTVDVLCYLVINHLREIRKRKQNKMKTLPSITDGVTRYNMALSYPICVDAGHETRKGTLTGEKILKER